MSAMDNLRRSKRIETQHNKELEILPNEIKEKIFLHLPPKDLKSLMLTSKTLHMAVGGSKKLMQPFTARASKMISAKFISSRLYPRIFFDCEVSVKNIERVKNVFINFPESLEVIIFNQDLSYNSSKYQIPGMQSIERDLAAEFIKPCTNLKTISLIPPKEKKLIEKHKMKTNDKTLSIYEWMSAVLCFNDVQVVNLYEGVIFDGHLNFHGMQQLKEINIYKQVAWSCSPFETYLSDLPNLQVITLQNIVISYEVLPIFHKLKELKVINCKFATSQPGDFLPEYCEVDELLIEGCNAIFWLQNEQHMQRKVKHLKLVRTFIPPEHKNLLEDVKTQVETLTIVDIFFKKNPKEPSQFLRLFNSDDSHDDDMDIDD